LNWELHRIASSEKYSSGLQEIRWQWTLDDVWDAHTVLDLIEEANKKALKKIEKDGKRK